MHHVFLTAKGAFQEEFLKETPAQLTALRYKVSAVTEHHETPGYGPSQFVGITNKADSADREQLEDAACGETPPQLEALKLFNKFLDLRPGESVQSSRPTLCVAFPPGAGDGGDGCLIGAVSERYPRHTWGT